MLLWLAVIKEIEEKKQARLSFFFLILELLPNSKVYIPNRSIVKATADYCIDTLL